MNEIEARLEALGVVLPEPAAPVANYVPFMRTGNQVHVSGQVSFAPEGLITGRLGADLDLEAGQRAARFCAINLIAQFKAACGGDLSRVKQVVKLGGFVNADPAFTDVPKVINGASDLIGEVFGESGRHARSAVGVAVLPLGAAVEVDAIIEVS
ncbi:MAG: RidA family protein [Alphaproteobacteria bacterium]|nr:RidA family protein [Alphaproteobacteria bacterium]